MVEAAARGLGASTTSRSRRAHRALARSAARTPPVVWLRRSLQLASLVAFCSALPGDGVSPHQPHGPARRALLPHGPAGAPDGGAGRAHRGAGLWLAMVTVAATLLLGRVFCGWVCPLGTVHTFGSALRGATLKERRRVGGYSRWQRAKYLVLAVFVGAALCGINAAGWLDPLSLLYRSLATAFYPASSAATRSASPGSTRRIPASGRLRATAISEPVYRVLRHHVLPLEQPHFAGGLVIGIVFLRSLPSTCGAADSGAAICARSAACWGFSARTRCCGSSAIGRAATAVASVVPMPRRRRPGRRLAAERVRLLLELPGSLPETEHPHPARAAARAGPGGTMRALARWLKGFARAPRHERPDISRRGVLAAGLAGASASLLAGVEPQGGRRSYNPALVRPPGSLAETEFLQTCIRCGECMKVCPTNALQPTLLRPAPRGSGRPFLDMDIGYCEYECTLCGQVCPTGAIRDCRSRRSSRSRSASPSSTRAAACPTPTPAPASSARSTARRRRRRSGSRRSRSRPRRRARGRQAAARRSPTSASAAASARPSARWRTRPPSSSPASGDPPPRQSDSAGGRVVRLRSLTCARCLIMKHG